MALDNRLTVYNEQGNPVDYDILASDVKFLPDGKDLPTKLAEMEAEIEDAGQVDEIIMNGQHYTPTNKVIDLGTVITQHQDISGKADKSTTYTKTETDNAIANAVEGLGGGSVESVTINGVNHEPTNGVVDLGTIQDGADGITPHIGQDGYWYIGSTNTGTKAQGPQGNSGVASGDEVVVVNNLDGGTTDTAQQVFVLGANMGKELNDKISPLSPLVETITGEDEIEYTENHGYRSYGSSIGDTYTETMHNDRVYVGRKLRVSAGDTLTVYGKTDVWCALYLLTDLQGKVLAMGSASADVSESNALTVEVQSDGYAYLSAFGSVAHGCTRSYSRTGYKVATESNDGIMSKEQVAMLNNAGGPDIEVLKGYVTDKTETITGVFIAGKDLKNYQVKVGDTYTGQTYDLAREHCALTVKAGDVVTLWCVTDVWNHGYVICDSDDKVVFVSGTNFSATESSPAVVNIAQDGKIWIANNAGESRGAVLQRESRVFRNATAEQDGLMPKEIAALFDGDSLNDDAASLKLKKFAFIGDSFSAPNQWQAKMCEVLGAFDSINKAVSGGAWWGDDNKSAYYQAQGLVSSGITPDYILCTLGTNDVGKGRTLGDNSTMSIVSQTIGTSAGDINPANSITEGVQAALITLKRAFPNAIIKIGYTPAGYLHDDVGEYAEVNSLCERLKDLANIYGVGYIETRRCGISRVVLEERLLYEGNTNGASFTGHPSAAGQQRIGEYMARLMLSNL